MLKSQSGDLPGVLAALSGRTTGRKDKECGPAAMPVNCALTTGWPAEHTADWSQDDARHSRMHHGTSCCQGVGSASGGRRHDKAIPLHHRYALVVDLITTRQLVARALRLHAQAVLVGHRRLRCWHTHPVSPSVATLLYAREPARPLQGSTLPEQPHQSLFASFMD